MARVAKSLEVLRLQLNALFPKRSKRSDGGIGDAAHSRRKSDHNPNGAGVVTARDFTHDPENGIDCHKLAEVLMKSRDPRIKYIIWNRRISSDAKAGTWKKYTGANAHTQHLHLSVGALPKHYDDQTPWNLDGLTSPVKKTNSVKKLISTDLENEEAAASENSKTMPSKQSVEIESETSRTDSPSESALSSGSTSYTAEKQSPELPIPVEQVKPESEPAKETTGIQASLAGAVTFITTSCMGILTWLGGVAWQIVAVLAIAAIVVGIIYIVNRFWFANKERQREFASRMEREKQAFELQKMTLESAMRRDLNSVTIKPQPIQNSEEPGGG